LCNCIILSLLYLNNKQVLVACLVGDHLLLYAILDCYCIRYHGDALTEIGALWDNFSELCVVIGSRLAQSV
jgi:hypothetical protein